MIDFAKEPSVNDDDFTHGPFSFDDVAAALKPIEFTFEGTLHHGAPPFNPFASVTTIHFHTREAMHGIKRRRNGVHHRQKARWVPVVTTFPVVGDITYTWSTE